MFNNKLKILFFSFFLYTCANDSSINFPSNNDIIFGELSNLNIITWNIENYPKHSQTNSYLQNIINNYLDIDIIALQEIENSDSFNQLATSLGENWISYRSENTIYGELSYLINTNKIQFEEPYSILNGDEYYFAHRPPYVLEFNYNNQEFILINIHYKCCGDGILDEDNSWDEEYRRLMASSYLHNYITENFDNKNIIVLGDFNDELIDDNNVLEVFLSDNEGYLFTDYHMAEELNPWQYWSYPSWPSHIDHILISNELFDEYEHINSTCITILLDNMLDNGWTDYDSYISDHRPVGLSLYISQ